MNLVKLKKLAKVSGEEILFGVDSWKSDASTIEKYADDASSVDDNSISDLKETCEDASGHLYEAAEEMLAIENVAEQWKDLAMSMWEDLDKDIQEKYISFWRMTDDQKQRIYAAFKLEDLKKL